MRSGASAREATSVEEAVRGQGSGGVAQPEAGDGLTGSCDNHCVGCHWELDSPSVEGREDEVIKLLKKRAHSNYHNYRPIATLPVLN